MSTTTQDSSEAVRPHGFSARVMHWGFVGLFAYALTKQLDEVEELEDFALLQTEMAFASLFLVLLIARFVFMRCTRPSALPANTPKLTKLMARSVHVAMYVSLSSIAVTGLLIGGLYWSGTKSGGAMDVALVLHEVAVHTSYVLIIGHVAAAIYHRRQGDGIWSAMVPFWKEPNGE